MTLSGKVAALVCAVGFLLTSCGEQKSTTSQGESSSISSTQSSTSSESSSLPADTNAENVKLGQARVITVVDVSGGVEVTNEGKTTAAFIGQRLKVGDEVSTKADGKITVKLDDSDLFTLSEDTVAAIEEASANSGNTRTVLRLVRGTVVNNVQSLSVGSDYLIKTSNTTMGVRGTVFAVYLKEEAAVPKLMVAEGAVAAVEGGEEQLPEGIVVPANSQLEVSEQKVTEAKANPEIMEELNLKELPDSAKESLIMEWLQRAPTDPTSLTIIQETLRENPTIAEHIPIELMSPSLRGEQTASTENQQQGGNMEKNVTAANNSTQQSNPEAAQKPATPLVPEKTEPELPPPPAVNMDAPGQPTDPRTDNDIKEPEKPTAPSIPEPTEPELPTTHTPIPMPDGDGNTDNEGTGGGDTGTPFKPKLSIPQLSRENVSFSPHELNISLPKDPAVASYQLKVNGVRVDFNGSNPSEATVLLTKRYHETFFYGEAIITLTANPVNTAQYTSSDAASYTTIVADEGAVVAASPDNWRVRISNLSANEHNEQVVQMAIVPVAATYSDIRNNLQAVDLQPGMQNSKTVMISNPTDPVVTEVGEYYAYVMVTKNDNLIQAFQTETVEFKAEQQLNAEVTNATHKNNMGNSSITFRLTATDETISIGDFFEDDSAFQSVYEVVQDVYVTTGDAGYSHEITGDLKNGYEIILTAIEGVELSDESVIEVNFTYKRNDTPFAYSIKETVNIPLLTPVIAASTSPNLTSTELTFTLNAAVPMAARYWVQILSLDSEDILWEGNATTSGNPESFTCTFTEEGIISGTNYTIKVTAVPESTNYANSAPVTANVKATS